MLEEKTEEPIKTQLEEAIEETTESSYDATEYHRETAINYDARLIEENPLQKYLDEEDIFFILHNTTRKDWLANLE